MESFPNGAVGQTEHLDYFMRRRYFVQFITRQAVELWRSQGSKVTETTWDMTLPKEQLSKEANKTRAKGNPLLFTHLTCGNHRVTWFVAYGIEGVQNWLFEQYK